MVRRVLFFLLGLLLFAAGSQAHIGSPDIYFDGKAGPYQLFVTIRPPTVIPGVAELEVRSTTSGIASIHAVPLPLSGPGAKFAPVPDKLAVAADDRQLFRGSLWMMAPGSWQVRVSVDGQAGPGSISIPVPSAALATRRMQVGLGAILSCLGLFLVGGLVAMVGASVREGRLGPGALPNPGRVRAGRIAMAVALVIVLISAWMGNHWWNVEAASYGQDVYKPLHMGATLTGANLLSLTLTDPGWLDKPGWHPLFTRSVDDFIPDHGHLMHLYIIRKPDLDVIYHLHPDLSDPGVFTLSLPSMPSGSYKLYADVVHANGFPETLASNLRIPVGVNGRKLSGDDAMAIGSSWRKAAADSREFTLPDGYRMEWLPVPGGLHARKPVQFRFRLTRSDGATPPDMAFYMGMLGHAAFVKTDSTVFAHIHPTGSVSMAAFMLAQNQTAKDKNSEMPGMQMEGMQHEAIPNSAALPNEVSFPYGFPSSGHYRIFVQMKHGQTVETGMFDADVT
ncbi:MAG: hypothetical protein M3Y72_19755 [Acidobacteriota bacterium]|nr:hypothetical protein [Acidobacteriota bacterium]